MLRKQMNFKRRSKKILLIRYKQSLLMIRQGKQLMMLPMTVSTVIRSKPRKSVTMLSGNVIKVLKMLRSQVILGNMLRDLLGRKKVRRVRNMLT